MGSCKSSEIRFKSRYAARVIGGEALVQSTRSMVRLHCGFTYDCLVAFLLLTRGHARRQRSTSQLEQGSSPTSRSSSLQLVSAELDDQSSSSSAAAVSLVARVFGTGAPVLAVRESPGHAAPAVISPAAAPSATSNVAG